MIFYKPLALVAAFLLGELPELQLGSSMLRADRLPFSPHGVSGKDKPNMTSSVSDSSAQNL